MTEDPGRPTSTELTRELELCTCVACGHLGEITGSFMLPGAHGAETYVRTRCLQGHLVVVPAFALPS